MQCSMQCSGMLCSVFRAPASALEGLSRRLVRTYFCLPDYSTAPDCTPLLVLDINAYGSVSMRMRKQETNLIIHKTRPVWAIGEWASKGLRLSSFTEFFDEH